MTWHGVGVVIELDVTGAVPSSDAAACAAACAAATFALTRQPDVPRWCAAALALRHVPLRPLRWSRVRPLVFGCVFGASVSQITRCTPPRSRRRAPPKSTSHAPSPRRPRKATITCADRRSPHPTPHHVGRSFATSIATPPRTPLAPPPPHRVARRQTERTPRAFSLLSASQNDRTAHTVSLSLLYLAPLSQVSGATMTTPR
jgi:hypothetical protein